MDATSGNIGETNSTNSITNTGKKTHVDNCAVVRGDCKPLIRRGRTESAMACCGQSCIILNWEKAFVGCNCSSCVEAKLPGGTMHIYYDSDPHFQVDV
jgi:hypothetical protein